MGEGKITWHEGRRIARRSRRWDGGSGGQGRPNGRALCLAGGREDLLLQLLEARMNETITRSLLSLSLSLSLVITLMQETTKERHQLSASPHLRLLRQQSGVDRRPCENRLLSLLDRLHR